MTRADWKLVAAVAFAGILALSATLYAGRTAKSTSGTLIVETDGRQTMRLPLKGAVRRFSVPGVGMTIEAGEGRVRVVSSDCPEQICVGTGWIGLPGQSIICVPNHTVFRLTGRGGPDAVSQ